MTGASTDGLDTPFASHGWAARRLFDVPPPLGIASRQQSFPRILMTLSRACLAAAAVVSATVTAFAQREPVLKQIDVPHHYYYREMYLPQATSGPGAAAWSPDGRELAVSMQGSLWRHVAGSTQATQLTDGPGYDYQPDWSPDGRFIAYATYAGDAVELRVLDVASGATRSLTANGAVNVEPRWSPDGRRLAFVSTAYNRRWHIHVMEMLNGEAGQLARLTEDNESTLPAITTASGITICRRHGRPTAGRSCSCRTAAGSGEQEGCGA